MGGLYILVGSNLEKCRKFWENGRFSWRIRQDWGNTARADMAGLGSIGLKVEKHSRKYTEEEHSRKYTEPEHLYVYECRMEITKVSKPVLRLMGITYLSRVFLGGYSWIGEILHGRIWPDWDL